MLRSSLDALTIHDTVLAREVISDDDIIDDYNRRMYQSLTRIMQENPASIKRALHLVSASRHLERIADFATNICEYIVYMVEGEVIRHQPYDFDLEEKTSRK